MAAMQILFAKLGIVTNCGLRRFHQQHAQHAVALLGDRAQLLPSARGVLARNQAQITGHLLEARDFGTLIWPHFGRLMWPHLIYSDRSSYPVPASRDGEGDGQETQGGTV